MSQEEFLKRMGFFDHLDELRQRLVRCLWIFFGGFMAFYFVSERLLMFLRRPLFEALPPESRKLYFTNLFENFLTHLKIGAVASVFFLSPYFFIELWRFISPGLKESERKLAVPFVLAASLFFLGGGAFAYYVLFPVGFKYFVSYGGPTEVPLLTMDAYYTTCLKLMVLFGLAFELPVIISFLGYLGLINATLLRNHRKNAVIAITLVSAVAAPPDALSMVMLAVPLYLMFELSIYVVEIFDKNRLKKSTLT